MAGDLEVGGGWVPDACTLPTIEQPLRQREFDELFARDVVGVDRESPGRVRLQLRSSPQAAARAARLAVKEVGCCSFFAFDLAIAGSGISLTITASAAHRDVLAALGGRAESRIGTGR